jgi:1-acyl-sn-glycerol-3-phosphate acyltransferase
MKLLAFVRSVIFEAARILLTVIFSIIAILTFPLPPIGRYRVITTWSRLIVFLARVLCGIRYRVEGAENIPESACIILSKHQSAWETLAFQVIFPPQVWVLRKSLLWIPFFGWGLAMMNPIAIDRKGGAGAMRETLKKGANRIENNWFIVMFPEGTRVKPGERKEYQVGGAWLATQLNSKIVPVALNAGNFWPKNAFIKTPGTITVKIGPAIETSGKKPKEVISDVENWIESTMQTLI